jgi:hypothetical protein
MRHIAADNFFPSGAENCALGPGNFMNSIAQFRQACGRHRLTHPPGSFVRDAQLDAMRHMGKFGL